MNPTCLLLGFLLLGPQIAAQTLNFEPPMTPGLVAATVNPEGWTCAQGGIVLPALGLPGPTSGFPTSGSQWGYLEPGTTTLGTSVPPGGPAPYPFTPSQTGHLRVPLAIPATTSPIELTIRWTYVNREGLQETTYNDFFAADLTNGAGVVLQSLLYRDTFSNFAAGVTPSAAGGSPGPHEIAPAGAPKISTFQIDPMLAGNPTVTLEFHVGNAADASVDGYAHIDQIQLQVLAPTYPGSGLDFALTTGVNGPLTSVDRKAVAVGDTVTLHFDSPGGTFDGRPFILASQTFAVGSYSGPTAGLSDIAINVALPFFVWSGLPGAPLGTFPLPTSGYTLPSQGFPGLEGLAFLFQGVVLSPVVANGYATSDGHELYYPARVYVSSTTGSSLGSGAASSPLASVSQAYALAKTLGNANLAIAAGTYSVNDLVLDAPIGFDGGLDSQTWQRASGQYSLLVTNHRGLRVVDVAAARFSGIDIRASDAPSLTSATASTREAASIALEVWGSGNGVRFEDCRFQAGRGANGVPGSNGTTVGSDGQTGGSGSAGYLVFTSNSGPAGGSGGSGARNGGTGGQGGRVTCVPGIFGACTSGSPAAGGGGGAGVGSGNNGGSGGNPATCNVATDGAGGNPGPVGSDGITGSPAATPGGFVGADGSWRPSLATDGANGVPGGGGGGGGGGGCGTCATQFVTGGSGGGGGGGGGGGSGGKGGSEGGASFAVYLREASPTFVACTFVAGQGGTGGAGGHGRNGGQGAGGGVGGNGVNVTVAGVGLGSGDGGQGGAGGPGGAGGGGGGAHGGPSFCVFQSGSSAPLGLTGPGQTFQVGLGGFGGLGGATGSTGNTAPSGSIGPAGLLGT